MPPEFLVDCGFTELEQFSHMALKVFRMFQADLFDCIGRPHANESVRVSHKGEQFIKIPLIPDQGNDLIDFTYGSKVMAGEKRFQPF